MATTDVTALGWTTIAKALAKTIAQQTTTFVSTHTEATIITDYDQYMSLLIEDLSAKIGSRVPVAPTYSITRNDPSSTSIEIGTHPPTSSPSTPASIPAATPAATPTSAAAPSKLPLILSVILGVISLLLITSLIGWYMLWRQKKHRKSATAPAPTTSGTYISELVGTAHTIEKVGSNMRITASPVEIDSTEKMTEDTQPGHARTTQEWNPQRTSWLA